LFSEILINAPFNSNLGLLVSIAGDIFLRFFIRFKESNAICGLPSISGNVGNVDASNVGTGMVGAPACGDVMKLQIKVGADGIIEDAKFKTYGC